MLELNTMDNHYSRIGSKDQIHTSDKAYRLAKVTSGLQEVLNLKYLEEIIENVGSRPKGYWGTAPTGRIHIGYFCPIMKIADLIDANCEVTILLADVHSFLDSRKSPLDSGFRAAYYQEMITQMLLLLKVDTSKVKFVKGSSFQYSAEYIKEALAIANNVPITEAKNAGTEVVKKSGNPKVPSLLYPIMQVLDEKFLQADFELGGIDQRKIFGFAINRIHKYTKQRITYLMNPIIPALSAESLVANREPTKMSSSETSGKLDLLDAPKTIANKIKSSYCKPGDVADNTPLALCKSIIFPILSRTATNMVIERSEKFGGSVEFSSYDELSCAFQLQKLHPSDLKLGIAKVISNILKPIRDHFSQEHLIELVEKAYAM
jgi:tyrosyl-tRNA synthetase